MQRTMFALFACVLGTMTFGTTGCKKEEPKAINVNVPGVNITVDPKGQNIQVPGVKIDVPGVKIE